MGWLQFVDSLKFQVSFAKEPHKRDIYSAKETYTFEEPTNRSHPMDILHRHIIAHHICAMTHSCVCHDAFACVT